MKKKNYLRLNQKFIFRLFSLLIIIGACSLNSFGQTQTFTANGNFVVPAGVTTVQVEAWGGGGAGGGVNGSSSSNRAGGGGSGGTYTKNLSVAVTPGANITVTVGAGGTGNSQADGGNGGTSTFASGTPINAVGGGGGKVGTSSPNNNGAGGGTATGITFNGGTGAAAASGNSGAGGGGAGSTGAGGNASGTTAGAGGAGGGGAGAAGLTSSGDGTDATALSGGGSGGRSTSSTDRTGGDGFRGQIKVTYSCISYSLTATSGATPVCVSTGSSVITVIGSAASLPVGTYTVTYNRSLPSATSLTATMTVTTAGTGSFTAAGLTSAGSSIITVTNLTSGAAGATCSSTISANNTSAITVNAAPSISVQPSAQAICTGSPVTFSVTGTGTPAPTYQWKKAGADISGATNSSFNIASVSAGDAGSYTVVLTNTCSALTSNAAALTLNSAPLISVHPSSQTKCTGTSVSFSVTANGTPAPTYQWRKDGVNISGATTAAYNIASVATGNAAVYDVIVTNTCGNNTSNAANLTVNVTPAAPTVTPSSTAVIAGQSASLTASGTETSFAWYSAPTGGTLLGSNAAFNTPGSCSNASYYAEQTSSAGCTSTRTSVAVTATPLAAPAAVNGSICGLGGATISGTPATGGNTCSWYAAASGGTALTINSISYSAIMNASGSLTYYASTKLSTLGCESTARTAVTATSFPEIVTAPAISAASVCPGSLVTVGSGASRSGKSIVNVSIPFALLSTTNANSPLTVSGFSSVLNNTSVKINYVKINLTHSAVGSLRVRLVAPDASIFNLTNQNGSGANFTNTVFQTGGAAITSGTSPYTGTFAPQQAFSNFNGKNPNGTWTLNVQNVPLSAAGTLLNWEINFIDANGLTYSWTSVPAGINSTSASITDNPLQNSSYNLVVNGPGSCTSNGSASVSMLLVPEPSASNSSPVCDGTGLSLFGSNSASGQTTGNTYAWTGPNGFNSSSQNPGIGSTTVVQSGVYTLTITNLSGCTSSSTTQVFVNPNPVLSINTQTNVSCNGLSDGQVDIDATSGTSPFLFDLVGPSTTDGIFTDLAAGPYTATVSDDNGCVSSPLAVTVTEPYVLSFNSFSNNESCLGSANGSITISATGGTAVYQYSIDNGFNFQNLNSFTNLSVGNYDLVVKDAHNCITASAPAAISTVPDVTPPVILNTPVSFSKCIDLVPVNWTAPVATDNCTTPILTSNHNPGEIFPVGVTTVIYTADDGNGNTSTSSFDVTVNALPTAVISNNNTICLGGSAQLHIDFTGTGPWNYVVSDGSQNIPGIALSSSHDVIVTPPTQGDYHYAITSVSDANCTGTSSGTVLVKVLSAPPAQNIISAVNAPATACNGDVLLITASTSGGQGVSYSWNQGSSSMTILFSENIGGPFTAGPFATDLPQVYAQFVTSGGWSGYYVCVKALNACGNAINKCKWVRGVVNAPGQITPATQVVACPDDIMNYSCGASNGATIYNWTLNGSPASISPNGGNNTNVQVTFPSTFISGQLCVTASLACQGSSVSIPRCISINKNPAGPSSITGINTVCSGTTAVSYSIQAVSGASGYIWTVPANATIATGANSPSITVDFPTPFTGSHSVCVTATSACGASTTKCKTVVSGIPNKPAGITGPLTNICGSTVQYSVVNPQAGLTYTWTNPSGTTISGSASGSTILLNVSPTFTNGFLTVVANSALCAPATSAPRTSSTFWGRPNTPGAITGNPELWCSGGYVNFNVAPAAPLPTYTWTVTNGTIDAGQGSNNIDVTWGANVAGTVSVKASNGCGVSAGISSQSFSSACREEGVNTLSEVAFSVYPNPAYENVTLSFNSIEKENVHVELIDLSGRAVKAVVYDADKGMNKVMIDLKKFSKGAYIVQIKSDKLYQQLPIILQ